MNRAGDLNRTVLIIGILLCIVFSSAAAIDIQVLTDNSTRMPVLDATVPVAQDLPVISTPPKMAPVNPAYLRYIQQQQAAKKLSSVTSITAEPGKPDSSHPTGLIPPYEDLSYLRGPFVINDSGTSSPTGTVQHTALSVSYDLRALGRVTPVKNQGNHGACWAFATIASLESTLLPGESWDFSENNMKNLLSDLYPEGFDRNFSKGGTNWMTTAYLTRWTGPINQSDDPYNETSPYSPTNKTVQKHVQTVIFIPDRINATDNDNIKAAVQSYGAVDTSYNVSDEIPAYWNETTNSYYYFGPDESNHAVAIVGWDDGWSRYNFTTVPPGDGAFIVKNSWGTTYGDAGYFYCSYYDVLMGKENALFIAEPRTNYDHIYQYDPFGRVTSIYTTSEKVGWAANVFSSTRNQNLSAVSFYTTDTNANYEVSVYWNPNNGPVLNSSGAAWTMRGTFGNSGYHTVAIPQEIPLDSNDRFAVAIKLTNPSYNESIAVQNKTTGTSKAEAYPGQGYLSDDGAAWSDVTTQEGYKNVSICIKAFTRDSNSTGPVASFTAAPTSGTAPLTVQFTDASTGSPTIWNWSFGDGSLTNATVQNPSHTYTSAGNYTVALTATNSAGSNTLTRTNYIAVTANASSRKTTIGMYRGGVYYLRNTNTAGNADLVFAYGSTGDIPVTGDWNGDGTTTIGMYRNGVYYLRNSNTAGDADLTFAYGTTGDIPVTGDWTGKGFTSIGIYRNGVYYLRNSNTAGDADLTFAYGTTGDIPVTGKWI